MRRSIWNRSFSGLRRFCGWWFAALKARQLWFASLRLVATAALVGFAFGYMGARYLKPLIVEETRLPKPVLPPPAGTVWVQALTTGYCPCSICCGPFSDGHTAINRKVDVYPFGIAAAPTLVPYRTMIDVPGYGLAMVDDTGGAMRKSATKGTVHFDLRFTTHGQARRWGRRWLYVALPTESAAAKLTPPVN